MVLAALEVRPQHNAVDAVVAALKKLIEKDATLAGLTHVLSLRTGF
jgi:hypothetical protein